MIGGARSPITTKNAMHVPPRKPIIETSMANLPAAPNTLKAKKKCAHIKLVSTARITGFKIFPPNPIALPLDFT